MEKNLWEVIKSFSGKEEIGFEEMALAEGLLEVDLFQIFKEQVESGLTMASEQWV